MEEILEGGLKLLVHLAIDDRVENGVEVVEPLSNHDRFCIYCACPEIKWKVAPLLNVSYCLRPSNTGNIFLQLVFSPICLRQVVRKYCPNNNNNKHFFSNFD